MTLLEKDSDLLSRDVEKSHWKTSIKIMCSVSDTDFSGVFTYFEQLQALNTRVKLSIQPVGMYAC